MSLLMENSVAKIGCGDPGDPITFGASFEGSNYLRFMDPTTSNQKAMFDFWFKGISSAFNSYIYSSPDLAGSSYFYLGRSGEKIGIVHRDVSNQFEVHTVGVLRDAASYRGLNLVIDTTQAVPEDRIQLRLGGVRVEITGTFPPQDFAMNKFGGTVNQYISTWVGSHGTPADGPGHLGARFIYTDDLDAYSYLDFGRFNADGDWVPKTPEDVTGLRYFVPFSDQSNMGLNLAGTDLVEVGAITQTRDTPTRDFATLDPNYPMSPAPALSEGNLRSDRTSNQGTQISVSTLPWYGADVYAVAEILASAQHYSFIGVLAPNQDFTGNYTGSLPKSAAYEQQSGAILLDGSTVQTGLPTATVGDRVGVFVSADGLVTFYKNETPVGAPVSIADWYEDDGLLFGHSSGGDGESVRWNFGQLDSPAYVPPSGYAREDVSMSANNLPCPDILNPEEYITTRFSTAGAGVSDLLFDPVINGAMVISKDRDSSNHFRVTDTVRGAGKFWSSSDTVAEITAENGLSAFTASGFDIDPTAAAPWLGTREDLILRKSPKAGFDILEIDHTTGTETTMPQLTGGMFDAAWLVPVSGGLVRVYYRALPDGSYLGLNSPGVVQSDPNWISGTANTVTIGAQLPTDVYRLKLFRSVPQFSFHGLYKGHSNGALVPLDFSPGPTFLRPVNIHDEWRYFNPAREIGNPQSKQLRLNSPDPQSSALGVLDQVSNGIRFRDNGQAWSQNDQLYVISSWAYQPCKFATAR